MKQITFPPATKTLPLGSKVAQWQAKRGVFMLPVAVNVPPDCAIPMEMLLAEETQ